MKHEKNSKRTLGWISAVAGASKWLVAGLVALQSLLSLTGIFYAFVLRAVINAAVAGKRIDFCDFFVFFKLFDYGVLAPA